MSQSEQEYVARRQGSQMTLYAIMRMMGISLSKRQEEFQSYLEKKYCCKPSYIVTKELEEEK